MAVTAAAVKELREITGAGMMECKRALELTDNNLTLAIEELRKQGKTKADKKANRIAAEGVILILKDKMRVVMVEVNCETDFVARDENFLQFANDVGTQALVSGLQDVAAIEQERLPTKQTVQEARQALIAKVGENINIRRIAVITSEYVGTYLHGNRIGVLVELDCDTPALAKDIAMQVAASKPSVVSPEDVSKDWLTKEREIYLAQAQNSGKSAEIIEKMVQGKLNKFKDEVSLQGQPFIKDPNVLVGSLLNKERVKVIKFVRFEVGEGIQKEQEDFVQAVMSQVQGM